MSREIKFRIWDGEAMYDWDDFKHSISWHLSGENPWSENECIVMQFTGLKDKNRKEIYEGDIVQSKGGFKNEIKWCEEDRCGEYGCVGWSGIINGNYGGTKASNYEVIGNIWENPELLK